MKQSDRVPFTKGLIVYIMSIDGSWRRKCTLLDISRTGARLIIADSVAGLSLKEFVLLFSASGRVFRRCGLIRLNGDEMGVRFIEENTGRAQKSGYLSFRPIRYPRPILLKTRSAGGNLSIRSVLLNNQGGHSVW
ncbi:PilZ domain-containing protein [Bradyrhizobium canariense]|uniref:PilZ domain-containing protein n=1 Tax=Bradyrhizobium canariense TaxID=255045 RepID=UPI00157C7CC0|nr:PilZ domain-containing protein [Bradyrhizobium canariense]